MPESEQDITDAQGELVADDFAYVDSQARIAHYDDLRSAPRITEIDPAPTAEYINNLATAVYDQSKSSGGLIPYTVIREVSENFIHARFKEIVVSIFDGGNTIRFTDQGPGISYKEQAQQPGFSSATEPMKQYIRGVGSGLPIVKEYLEFSHGQITIEDNLGTGSVITISMNPHADDASDAASVAAAGGQVAPGAATAGGQVAPDAAAAGVSAVPFAASGGQVAPGVATAGGQVAPGVATAGGQVAPGVATTSATAGAPAFVPASAYAPASVPEPGVPSAAADPLLAALSRTTMPASAYARQAAYETARTNITTALLSQKEREFLPILLHEESLGVSELSQLTETAVSSTYHVLKRLEEEGLVERLPNKKRSLTDLGKSVALRVEK